MSATRSERTEDKSNFLYKQVIAVRCDLGMSAGKIAAQVAHAAVGAAENARKSNRRWLNEWLKEGQKKVVVKVNCEKDLIDLEKKVDKAGLPNELVRDAGLTELPPGTVTALAVGPAPSELIDGFTGNLPLL